MNRRVEKTLDMITQYGGHDGGHHKQWLLNQIVKCLTGTKADYEAWIKAYEEGDEGPKTYEWDKGIAP